MLDSVLKTLVKETADNVVYIKASVKKQDVSSFFRFNLLVILLMLYQFLNNSQFRELKKEIKALKNPAVSAEIAIDKPAESR